MATSFTGEVQADDFETLTSKTGVTFTSGKKYNFQVRKQCQIKVGDAVFDFANENFDYNAGSNTIYIKTGAPSCGLTILEG